MSDPVTLSDTSLEGTAASAPLRPRIVTVDAPERHRYEARVAGVDGVATVHYRRAGDVISLSHTLVPAPLEGRGVGAALARFALDEARRSGRAVLPYCPFVAAFIRRHLEYLDLVPRHARARFALPETASPTLPTAVP